MVLGVCTGGVLFLIAKWFLAVRILLRLKRCALRDATFVRTTVSHAKRTPGLARSWRQHSTVARVAGCREAQQAQPTDWALFV